MDVCSFLKSLKLPFHFEFDKFVHNKNSSNFATIRSNLNSAKDACTLVKEIGKKTNTHFHYCYQIPDPELLIFRKKWICQYANYKKSRNSNTNLECPVFIEILIKKITDKTQSYDPYLKSSKPLPCVIKLRLAHTHNVNEIIYEWNAPKVSAKIRYQFEGYFNKGMNVNEALEFHESKFIYRDEPADNPTYTQVNYVYEQRKKKKKKEQINAPFKPIIDKIPLFESQGTTVKFSENLPWSVIVVTSVMKRLQSLCSSRGIILIDSTTCRGKNDIVVATVTTMMTVTKVGVLPIAVLLHQSQSLASYNDAFILLGKHFPECFGGATAPNAFMTENISTLKDSLKTMWETSEQLLYHYHITQVEWRWLMSADCGDVEKSIRKDAMHIFLSVMYAENEREIHEAEENALQLSDVFPAFVERLNSFLAKKKEWLLLYSLSYFHYTDKFRIFCENSVRIFKDVILCKTQKFFILPFIEFCISVWEVHIIETLLEHVNSSISQQNLLYASLTEKYATSSTAPVQQIDSETFLVPSSSVKNLRYIVQTKLGFCTCNSGKFGAFCKHLTFLFDQNHLHSTWTPTLTPFDQFSLTKVALGEEYIRDIPFPSSIEDEEMDIGEQQIVECSKDKIVTFTNVSDYYRNPHSEQTLNVSMQPNVSKRGRKIHQEQAFENFLSAKHKNRTELMNDHSEKNTGDAINNAVQLDMSEIIAEMNKDLEEGTLNQDTEQTNFSLNLPSTTHSFNKATETDVSQFKEEVIRLSKFDIHRTRLIKLTKFLSNIKDSAQLNQALTYLNSSLSDFEKKCNKKL